MNNNLDTSPAKSDVITEELNNTDNIPIWMEKLKVQGLIGKSLYFVLLFFR